MALPSAATKAVKQIKCTHNSPIIQVRRKYLFLNYYINTYITARARPQ